MTAITPLVRHLGRHSAALAERPAALGRAASHGAAGRDLEAAVAAGRPIVAVTHRRSLAQQGAIGRHGVGTDDAAPKALPVARAGWPLLPSMPLADGRNGWTAPHRGGFRAGTEA